MLAYLFWHWQAGGVGPGAYAEALEAFHASLADLPPSGFHRSASFRLSEVPWIKPGNGELHLDWYLVADWNAVGKLNEAAVSPPHQGPHDRVASLAGGGSGAIYLLRAGHPNLQVRVATWVEKPRDTTYEEVLGQLQERFTPESLCVWQRQLVLGPAPELCVLAAASAIPQPELETMTASLSPVWVGPERASAASRGIEASKT
jgi:hypothetical protein